MSYKKLAEESPALEAVEHPEGGAQGMEQLLSQLSPEELEHLATELSANMQHPEAQEGGEDVAELAQAIQEHLAQSPEAVAGPEVSPEKAAAFEILKSASCIEGFIKEALASGLNVGQAVDLYDQELQKIAARPKTAPNPKVNPAPAAGGTAGRQGQRPGGYKRNYKQEASDSFRKALDARKAYFDEQQMNQHVKMFMDSGMDPMSAHAAAQQVVAQPPATLPQAPAEQKGAWQAAMQHFGEHPMDMAGGAALLGGTGLLGYHLGKNKEDDEQSPMYSPQHDYYKQAAYIEGMYERALEYGLSSDDAAHLVGDFLN